MNGISKKLSKFVAGQQKKLVSSGVIMPVKVEDGILVGSVKIVQEGTVKHLYQNGELVYANVSLNSVAVFLANILALRKDLMRADSLYRADQTYSKWYNDCENFMISRRSAVKAGDYERADMLLARYQESKSRAVAAKNLVERLMQN